MRRVLGACHRHVILALLVLTALGAFGVAAASAAEPPPYHSSFGPDGTEATEFDGSGSVGAIAVDQGAHRVYVMDGGAEKLYKFDTEGNAVNFTGSALYISGNALTFSSFGPNAKQVAVDPLSHDIYVTVENSIEAFQPDGEEAEFTAGPWAGTNSIGGFDGADGVTVDANGDIYASDSNNHRVKVYSHTGELITQLSDPEPKNIAVDSNGNLYVQHFSEGHIHKYVPSEFPVTATTTYTTTGQPFTTDESQAIAVDPATNDVYATTSGSTPRRVDRFDEDGALLATFAGPGEDGEIEGYALGIAVFSEQEAVFVSKAPAQPPGRIQVEIFWEPTLPGPPKVRSASVTQVTSNTATLQARINPSRADTTYRFEYGLQDCSLGPCTSVPLSAAGIGAGHKLVPVSQDIAGLQGGTTYHFRVFAANEHGDNQEEDGVEEETDHTFTTQSATLGFSLGDNRAWEMVSPPAKHGAQLQGSTTADVQAAADGNGITLPSRGSIEAGPEGDRIPETSTVLSRRTPGGWRSKDITLPNNTITQIILGPTGEYKLFNSDLSTAIVEPHGTTPFSADASERTPYLRQNSEPPLFTPLLTASNVAPGTEFGGDPGFPIGPVTTEGSNSELTHIVLSSEVPLLSVAPPAFGEKRALYVWSAGNLQPVSVLPPGEGGEMVYAELLGSGMGSTRNAISDDGSRVFWSTGRNTTFDASNQITGLYLRDTAAEESVRLDAVKGGTGDGEPRPVFQAANPAGTVVLFTDSQQLTPGASHRGADLYRCEIPPGPTSSGCSSLIDLSLAEGPGESAALQGIATGASEDGSTIYFVAKGVLDDTANEFGDRAQSNHPNLYVWQATEGVRFIAALARQDVRDWGGGAVQSIALSAFASPSGRYLAFMSEGSLTGEENLDPKTGHSVQRVFRYDASAERLDCVSCDPTGSAPEGGTAISDTGLPGPVDPRRNWEETRMNAVLPERTTNRDGSGSAFYSPRALLDNGRLFFNAIDSLVPADSNGEWDVYQYEPDGVGDCSESSGGASVARIAGGCVSLISSGTAEEEAGFLDASESGDDVFFLTSAQLNEPDEDEVLDVYDARVNGVPLTRPLRAECLGEACQPLPVVPNDQTPASSQFEGKGNVHEGAKRCSKGRRRVRRKGTVLCVRRHQRHAGKHRPAGRHRRAGR